MRKTFLNSTQYLEQQPYSLKAKKDLNTYSYMIKKRFLGRMKNKESNMFMIDFTDFLIAIYSFDYYRYYCLYYYCYY